jgi:hypothetical protein
VKKEKKKMNIELKEKPENKQKDENLNMTNMEINKPYTLSYGTTFDMNSSSFVT